MLDVGWMIFYYIIDIMSSIVKLCISLCLWLLYICSIQADFGGNEFFLIYSKWYMEVHGMFKPNQPCASECACTVKIQVHVDFINTDAHDVDKSGAFDFWIFQHHMEISDHWQTTSRVVAKVYKSLSLLANTSYCGYIAFQKQHIRHGESKNLTKPIAWNIL